MARISDIHTLTDFQRRPDAHIQRLRESGRPELLTVDGEGEAVIQDVTSYQKLLDSVDRAEAIAGIQRGLDSMAQGEGSEARTALDRIRAKHRIAYTAFTGYFSRSKGKTSTCSTSGTGRESLWVSTRSSRTDAGS